MKRIAIAVGVMLPLLAVAGSAQSTGFTQWSAPVSLGPPVNSAYMDTCPSLSKNGLSLYFASNRHTGDAASPDWDLYVSQRAGAADPWGEPQRLPNVNLAGPMDSCPALSPDEHRLYFVSNRPGGCGGADIYVSRRQDRRNDLGWETPVPLACAPDGPNGPTGDYTPALFEDEAGNTVMYFSSNRSGSAGFDIYASRMKPDDTFGPATPVTELNSPSGEQGVAVRRDGREAIFGSTRPDPAAKGDFDLWMATRDSTSDPWSKPVILTVLNSASMDGGKLSLSFDGRALYFRSNRTGAGDIYVAKRLQPYGYCLINPAETSGGGASTPPQMQTKAIAGPKDATVTSRQIQLDGSQSTSADGKPLTYLWTIPPGSPLAAILGEATANPTVQFAQGRATYTFQLTVTDSAGKSSTDLVTVNYLGN